MVIVSKNHILLPSEDQSLVFPVPRGWMGEAPDWATSTRYFRELVADGKIIVSESRPGSGTCRPPTRPALQ